MAPIRRRRWADELQHKKGGKRSAHGRLCRAHPEGGRSGRFAGRAINALRTRDQPEDRKIARLGNSPTDPPECGRSDRINWAPRVERKPLPPPNLDPTERISTRG